MIKYYFFASLKDIQSERFSDALHNAYKNIFAIKFTDSKSGYVMSDEYLYDYLESLLSVISSDTDNSYTVVSSHEESELSRAAIRKAVQGRRVYLTNMADLILNLALDGDYELLRLAKKRFALVSRELMMTAETFISCGLNASLAAKKLYIHRNTFSYRLNQFIEATDLDIRDYHNAQFFSIVIKLLASGKGT
jgi:sugar diacid utilization regulator